MFVGTTKLALNPGCPEKADYSLRPEGAIRDFWRPISETRNSPQGTVVPAARIDLTALTTLGGPGCLVQCSGSSLHLWVISGTFGVVARAAGVIELSESEEQELRGWLRRPSIPQQQAIRARIVLRAAEGASNTQIAAETHVSLPTVGLWRRKFL